MAGSCLSFATAQQEKVKKTPPGRAGGMVTSIVAARSARPSQAVHTLRLFSLAMAGAIATALFCPSMNAKMDIQPGIWLLQFFYQ
jgi:hypothetical protein